MAGQWQIMAEKEAPALEPSGLHTGRCKVCKSLHRKEVDRMLWNWGTLKSVSERFPEFSIANVWQHLHGSGLARHRFANWDGAINAIIDRGMEVMPTADSKELMPLLKGALQFKGEASGKLKRGTQVTQTNATTIIQTQEAFDKRLEQAVAKNNRLVERVGASIVVTEQAETKDGE